MSTATEEWLWQLCAADFFYLSLCLLTLILLHWYGTLGFDLFSKMGIDESKSWKIPYLGHIADVWHLSMQQEKRAITSYSKRIYGMFIGRVPFLCVFDVEFLKAITIKEFSNFTNRRNTTDAEGESVNSNIFNAHDDQWKNIRAFLTPTFTSGKLKVMYPVISSCGDKLVKQVEMTSSEPMVIKDYSSRYTMDVIASTAFGLDLDVQSTTDHPFMEHAGTFLGIPRKDTYIAWIKNGVLLYSLLVLPLWLVRLISSIFGFNFVFDVISIKYFDDIIDRIIGDRQICPEEKKDFLSMCIDKTVDLKDVDPIDIRTTRLGYKWSKTGLTHSEVRANATTFFSAGYESTAAAIQFLFYCLAIHPEIQEDLYESINNSEDEFSYEELQRLEYLEWCINETLRMFPPALRFDRQAKESIDINGIHIPKGMIVNFMPAAMHYNPEYWPLPDVFRPERFSPANRTEPQQYAFIPFGSGGRSCIAVKLAMLEIKVAASKMLKRFRIEKTSETPDMVCFSCSITHRTFLAFAYTDNVAFEKELGSIRRCE